MSRVRVLFRPHFTGDFNDEVAFVVSLTAADRCSPQNNVAVGGPQSAIVIEMSLSHLDEHGRAQMVDVSAKADTERVAIAKGEITMQAATLALIRANKIAKGEVFAVARVAGILAAKRTHELIPMCHPLLITDVAVDFEILAEGNAHERARVGIVGTAKNVGKTGVEMEALVAVTTAALTIYDMAKAVDRAMRIENVRLVLKRGGKSGEIVLE